VGPRLEKLYKIIVTRNAVDRLATGKEMQISEPFGNSKS